MYQEIEDTRKALCERCRKFVPVSDIKYLPKGNSARMALCKKCLSTFSSADEKKKKAFKSASVSSSKNYFCSRCKYKFKFNTQSNATLRCPFCGKGDKVLEDKQIDANSILEQSEY
jgi:DNA-directed RNA polymerase subunit RPC12/RpoP